MNFELTSRIIRTGNSNFSYERSGLKMPYFSRRILVSLCPFVNLDLFKKGYYHVSVRLVDQSQQSISRVECVEIKDMFGPQLTEFSYPGACDRGDHFITQTILVEYTEQSFLLGEYFLFKSDSPVKSDHTDAYLPSHFSLHLDLMFCGDEDLPKDPSSFASVSSRNLDFTVDWRKGLHDHFPVFFDYFHMAAVGVTVHSSLLELCLDDFHFDPSAYSSSRRKSLRGSVGGRRWSTLQSQNSAPVFPSLHSILFGSQPNGSAGSLGPPATFHPLRSFSFPSGELGNGNRQSLYQVPKKRLERAQDAHQMLCDVLRSARDSLHIGHSIMSHERSEVQPGPEVGDLSLATSLEEAEKLCFNHLTQLNASLAASWEWFCASAVVQPEMTSFLANRAHHVYMEYALETVIPHDHPLFQNHSNFANSSHQSVVAAKIRKNLSVPMAFFCKENVETSLNCSVIFVEPPPWPVLPERSAQVDTRDSNPLDHIPGTAPGLEGFTRSIQPYLIDSLPKSDRVRSHAVHLVVCIHGLQGNQFDLRLYRIFLTITLPQIRFDFLMTSSNQADTFCDFNLMTDRLLEEVLQHIQDMPTPPSKISFIGHSLGSIIVRSLVTRPEFARLHSKLHLFFSICGPHLGTKYQNGIVSVGMWAVRKWYNSKSLLQLSLKDAPNPYDSFMYHLSESPSLECFRHVVLLASPQDKYVPYHSAKIATLSQDASFQSSISLRMMQNILEPLRKAQVNLVRISVDHSIPTSANSVIGRAAHIAMLDNELFIQKLISLHLAQFFVES